MNKEHDKQHEEFLVMVKTCIELKREIDLLTEELDEKKFLIASHIGSGERITVEGYSLIVREAIRYKFSPEITHFEEELKEKKKKEIEEGKAEITQSLPFVMISRLTMNMRKEFPRAGLPWSQDDWNILREEAAKGTPIKEIARRLQRQLGAVMAKLTDFNQVDGKEHHRDKVEPIVKNGATSALVNPIQVTNQMKLIGAREIVATGLLDAEVKCDWCCECEPMIDGCDEDALEVTWGGGECWQANSVNVGRLRATYLQGSGLVLYVNNSVTQIEEDVAGRCIKDELEKKLWIADDTPNPGHASAKRIEILADGLMKMEGNLWYDSSGHIYMLNNSSEIEKSVYYIDAHGAAEMIVERGENSSMSRRNGGRW